MWDKTQSNIISNIINNIQDDYKEAAEWVRKLKNAETEEEIGELKYWHGKRTAIGFVLSLLHKSSPTNTEKK